MSYQVNVFNGVLTVRIDGRCNAQELYQELLVTLGKQSAPVAVILDLTLARSFDQVQKAMSYRVLQHGNVGRTVGVCGVSSEIDRDVKDLLTALTRVRKVVIAQTEIDVRASMGLSAPLPDQRKLSGMLAYLKKA